MKRPSMMKGEIAAAAKFVLRLVKHRSSLPEATLTGFENKLKELLTKKFRNHWHPNSPWRGQAYRCLRINEQARQEPTIEKAAAACGISYDDLKLPVELTIWVDPEEVSCRFGELKGSHFTIASFHGENKENVEKIDLSTVNFNLHGVDNVLSKDRPPEVICVSRSIRSPTYVPGKVRPLQEQNSLLRMSASENAPKLQSSGLGTFRTTPLPSDYFCPPVCQKNDWFSINGAFPAYSCSSNYMVTPVSIAPYSSTNFNLSPLHTSPKFTYGNGMFATAERQHWIDSGVLAPV